jgi:hypothetical protein
MKMNSSSSAPVLLLLFGCILLLTGCTTKVPTGNWQVHRDVQKIFETATVLPDHTYYYLGSSGAPESVIAISNEYTLRTKVWARAEITEKMLRGWRQWHTIMDNSSCRYYGGVIFTPDGRSAGVWYSPYIINTVRMPEPGVLVIFQPVSPFNRTCDDSEGGTREIWSWERGR